MFDHACIINTIFFCSLISLFVWSIVCIIYSLIGLLIHLLGKIMPQCTAVFVVVHIFLEKIINISQAYLILSIMKMEARLCQIIT